MAVVKVEVVVVVVVVVVDVHRETHSQNEWPKRKLRRKREKRKSITNISSRKVEREAARGRIGVSGRHLLPANGNLSLDCA